MKLSPYFLFSLFLLGACQNNQELLKPQVKPLIEAVYAPGFVVSKDEYEVYSQAEGYLSEKLVADGEDVKQGDPLFIIESDQQSSRYRLAKENYDMALSNYRQDSPVLEELRAAIQTARTKVQFDSLNYVRYSNLLKNNAATRSDFDRIKLSYDNSRNEYALQKSRFEKTKNQLYIEMQNAKSQLQIASNESGRYTIRSQVDGKVFKTMKEKGELVRRNETVAVIGKDSAFFLELSVDELDVQRIKVNQEVVVKIDAYPDKTFNARVTKIYPLINKQQQSIRVDADLTDQLPGVFSGLALEANIIIQKKEKALVIPKAALLPGDSLNLKTPEGFRKIKVVKGIETMDEVEIVQGLDSVGSQIGYDN
jgi:multidrug efflux pump subunit AcrA (membrane-fusion protein)